MQPQAVQKLLAYSEKPNAAGAGSLTKGQSALWHLDRLVVPALHVLITDDKGMLLGRASLAPILNLDKSSALATTWRCLEFCVFQGAQPKVSYGLSAACLAIMRELRVPRLIGKNGREMLGAQRVGGIKEVDDAGAVDEAGCADRLSRKTFYRLLELAEVSDIEMELYICNSDAFKRHVSYP